MSESSTPSSEIATGPTVGYFHRSIGNLHNNLNKVFSHGFNFMVTPLLSPDSKEFNPLVDVMLDSQGNYCSS